jgi:hypothetical protein
MFRVLLYFKKHFFLIRYFHGAFEGASIPLDIADDENQSHFAMKRIKKNVFILIDAIFSL